MRKFLKFLRKRIVLVLLLAAFILVPIIFYKQLYMFYIKAVSRIRNSGAQRTPSIIYWVNENLSKYETVLDIPVSQDYIIVISKREHKLQLVQENAVIREYNVNLLNKLPDRLLENDEQTPEGVFKVYQLAVVTDPPWSRWIAFDTTEKAKTIFKNEYKNGSTILSNYVKKYGRVSKDEDIRIFNFRNPETPMLRGFGIHGGGYHPNNDWTIGCPALDDEDVVELYKYLKRNPQNGMGTKVFIQD